MHTEALQLRNEDRWLYTYAAEPGSRSAEATGLLGTWVATQDADESADQARASRSLHASSA